jgi:hypothetical protein
LEIVAVTRIKRITAEIAKVVSFCQHVGITLQLVSEERESFLPGVWIEDGIVYCNPANLTCIGDLLHERGHFAVAPASYRGNLNGFLEFGPDYPPIMLPDGTENPEYRKWIDGCEQATIAWSYAAAVEIGFDPYAAFDQGPNQFEDLAFDGEWLSIAKSLAMHSHPGLECLINTGMTTRHKWPQMNKWLQN